MIVTCSNCGAQNQIPQNQNPSRYKCYHCHTTLPQRKNDQVAAGAIAGAAIGAVVAGPPGAAIGALFGALLGAGGRG